MPRRHLFGPLVLLVSAGVLIAAHLVTHPAAEHWLFIAPVVLLTTAVLWWWSLNRRHHRLAAERLERVFAAVGDGCWDWDAPSGRVYFSSRWKAMLGFADDEIGDRLEEWSERIHPDDREQVLAEVDRHLRGETVRYQSEHRLRCKDGSWLWVLDRGRIIDRERDGRPRRVVGSHTDVSARRLAESALEAERSRHRQELEQAVAIRTAELRLFKTVIEQNPVAIVITDAAGRATYRNPAFAAELGGEADGWAPPEMRQAIAAGQAWDGEFPGQRNDGGPRWLHASVAPLSGEDGRPLGAVGFLRDITRMKEEQAAARARSDDLIQTEKLAALGTLVAGLAHEISNPANFISLNAPLVRGFWSAAAPVLDAHAATAPDFELNGLPYAQVSGLMPQLLSGMDEGVARIRRIVGELRDFARPDRGQELARQDLDLVVQSAIVITSQALGKATRHFTWQPAGDLPAVLGSYQRLQQVVVNLLLNACQALTGPEQAIRIATSWDAQRRMVGVAVSDQGIGIPAGDLHRVGEPFFTTKRGRGGTGLGLAVSQRIVGDHQGELRIDSAPGRGTTVLVHLPAADRVESPDSDR